MMKNIIKKTINISLVISLIALPLNVSATTLQEYEDEVAKYQAQINEKKAQLAKNNETIATVQAKIKSSSNSNIRKWRRTKKNTRWNR